MTNDRLTFNCSPKPSDFTKQLCYDKYTSTMSPLLIPRNFAIITYAVVLAGWICFMLYAAGTLRQISREQATTATDQRPQAKQNHRRRRSKFLKVYVLHVVVRLLFLGVMIGLFCSYQTLDLPSVFKCGPVVPQKNTTSTPVTETVLQCNDLHYKEKSNLNIAIVFIESSILMLGILEVIHLSLTRKTFLKKFLGNMEFNMENVPLERDVERDVKPAEVDAPSQNRSPATNENVEEEQSLAYSNAEQRQAVLKEKHNFTLSEMSVLSTKTIPEMQLDFAMFVVHAHESVLSINNDGGYSKVYRALLQATDQPQGYHMKTSSGWNEHNYMQQPQGAMTGQPVPDPPVIAGQYVVLKSKLRNGVISYQPGDVQIHWPGFEVPDYIIQVLLHAHVNTPEAGVTITKDQNGKLRWSVYPKTKKVSKRRRNTDGSQ
ncbi:hypothetical protein OS493_031757 [Desmophyllum pertusum]|uniref:Uncharacterized protein n=1 Tax=Desmophyllum pertusum TaxID=174260 RepID=A0A9W9Z9G8_9CNID|nr:hypothetical protein OS493_031757 [Desmophyllum pertusum]